MSAYAISDIHGCKITFEKLLQKIRISKKDELFLLGDYVDRGPDSRGVLDFIFQLQSDGFSVICLMGNHEEMLLQSAYDPEMRDMWQRNGGRETLQNFGAKSPAEIPQKYRDWMQNLPRYFEFENYLLVHAGLDFRLQNPLSDPGSLIWIRDWYDRMDYDWLAGRKIVHGHTPRARSFIEQQCVEFSKNQVLDIDVGCAWHMRAGMGLLCAFDLREGVLHFQEYHD